MRFYSLGEVLLGVNINRTSPKAVLKEREILCQDCLSDYSGVIMPVV